MSRVGKLAVQIPEGVEVNIEGSEIRAKGKEGMLSLNLKDDVQVTLSDKKISLTPANDSKHARALWGTYRSLIQNIVTGVAEGFVVRVEIKGVGYRAQVSNNLLSLSLGYSHEIKYAIPDGVSIKCEKPTLLVISGADKQLVGQVSGELLQLRKVEPYKGKGVFVEGSYIRRKEGKKK